MRVCDDLGAEFDLQTPIRRIVSLVPSLTESLETTRPGCVVGATDWCTHPPLEVTRIRGTKNPDIAAIAALQPDLVVANKEENRLIDVKRLRDRNLDVWVTKIDTADEAFSSLDRLLTTIWSIPTPEWLAQARKQWSQPTPFSGLRVAVPIWKDPWMWVGSDTFTHDLLEHLGCQNLGAQFGDRYPAQDVDALIDLAPDVVILPDEPFCFTPEQWPDRYREQQVAYVAGRMLTWYGPSLVDSWNYLNTALSASLSRG